MISTLLIPGFGEDVPNGAYFLYPCGGDGSAADPVFDAGDVDYDLSLEGDSVAGRPEADMFYEAASEVLAVGSDDYPPALIVAYQ